MSATGISEGNGWADSSQVRVPEQLEQDSDQEPRRAFDGRQKMLLK